MEFKNIGKHMSEYFRYRLGQKTVAFILLLFFNFNIFSEIVPDPASIGTKVTQTASGVDQIDIARPNVNGTSYNSLRELQVGERGLILNNNKNVVVQTEIAGLVARNRNLDNGTEANLIITEITGKNRTGINGYVEVAGKRADIVIANRNGIHVNGGGFLNSDRVTLTTGRLNMENGDLKSIDVTEGKVSIGEKGVDVLSLSDFELIGKTVDISGIIKGSKDTRVLISTGGQTYEYRTKKVTGKGETYEGIAVDGKAAGSMYAGKIDIISNDKGAGVNTKGDLVSIDDVTITANGDITTNKVHSEKRVVYNTTKKVKIRKQTTAGKQVTVRAKKTEIDVDAKVITGYLEKALGEASFKAEGEEVSNKGEIQAEGRINIKSRLTENSGEMYSTVKTEIEGEKLDNSRGTLKSVGKIDINTSETVNREGYILSDGLTKEEVQKEEASAAENMGAPKEHGVNISGKLDNTRGVIRGRDITVGGDLVANEKGQIRTSGNVNLNGKSINNARGEITGNIGKLNAERLINDDGKLTSSKRLEGIIKETSNRNGEIYGSEGIKIIGEKLSNLSGTVRSDRKINLEVNMTDNTGGHILSDGITKEEVEKDREEKKEETGKKSPELSEAGEDREHGVNISGKLDNTRGVIRGRDITVGGDLVANEKGQIRTSGNVNLNGKSINNAKGEITGNIGKLNAERLINDDGKLTSIDKIEGEIKEISNIRGEILGEESIKIIGEKLNNFSGVLRSGKNIETELKELNNREGYILKDGITKEEAQKWAVQKIAEKAEEKPSSEEVKQQDGEKDRKYASAGPNAIRKVEPSISAERLDNTRGIIASLTGTYIKTSDISNSGGKIVSRNEVVLDMPSDYTYEGLVAGDASTVIRAGTVTVNGKMNRSDALTLVGKHGVNLKDDITARVLTLDTGSSVLNNARNIRGEEGLSISSLNIINDGNILSGGTLLVNARGKVYNSAIGLMSGKNVQVDAEMIENNRGKILSDGSLSLIAETLIRNDNGIVDSKDEMYLKVANGRLENTGTSEILIDYVKKQTGTQPETKKKTFGRRAVMVLDEAVQEQERVLNINMKDSVIRSGKNLYMDINGDVINSDGGKITAAEEIGIKANNVYNIGKYIQDVQKNELVSGAGGRIEAGKVFLKVKGKVVNGTEDYLTGAYRRGDGVLVDNRQVTSISPSEIKGREVTRIDTGELINTSHIGGTGITIVDTERNLTNASIGNAIAVIDGKEVLVDGKGGVHNIGAEIRGNEVTQVLSEKGKIVNESTVKVEKTEAPVRPERVPSFFRVFRNDTPQEMRESIRNIGKIESNGTAYVKAKNEVINIAGNIKGKNGTYVGSESGNIEDRTVTLHYEGRNVVETKTEIREIPVMKRIKFREVPTGEVRKEEVTASTKWDHRKTTETVSGEIGDGADTVIEAGKDLILESSNIRGKDNIVLNAKNYILMLSTVNTDTKDRTETHKSGKKLGKRKTTTNSWYVDNEYVNGVDLTTDGNIVLNWDINGKKRGANKGIFAQGVNFNAKGQVGAYSDGNIYVQGTKDRIHEIFNSHTVKRFGGVKYGSKHDYVNSKIERYRHTQLYGEAGITLDSEGKLKVEGADVQSYGNVLLRGKQGVEILPGEEINSRYEEHTSKGIKASLNAGWNGISAGVGYQKTEDRISELTKNVISNNIQAGGDVEIRSEEGNITMGPTDGFVGGKLKLDGNDIDIIDAHSERIIDTVSKKTYIGVGVTAGIPVIGAAKQLIDAGRAIGKSKHKEDYLNSGFGAFNAGMGAMNAFGNLFTSPMATSASLNYSKSQDSYHREERISVGSRLHVKGGVEYNGKNLHTVNLNMLNEGDTVYNITGNIIREAGKSTIKESTGSRGYGLSLAKGSDGMNPFKGNGTTVTASTSGSKGKSEGVYYTNPKDETKGNSHYNVGGDVKDSGVDIKTGSISGKIEGNHTVESLQDTFDSRSRGYSISTGIGINSTKGNKGTTYNTNIHSVSAGYSQGKTVQRITREVSEFTAGSGMLEVKGETRQTGSLIDGGFTLNTGGYSKEDLHDVNKTRNVGVNVTVYPNTVYSKRDKNGERVYVNGQNPKEKGVAIGIGISYTDIDKKRDVAATVGNGVNINHDISGVNRDPNKQTGEFEGREITGVNVNLGTEYWLTAAGRGKTRDIIEDAGETADGIRRVLTWKDENGNLRVLESIETENLLRKFMQIGFVDTKGKTQKQVKEELEKRFGSLAKKGVSVNFYDGKDIKGSGLDENTLSKLLAHGFAVTKDGTVWINKDHVDSGKLIDFNKVTQHEISHIVFGEDSEFQAQYLTKAYGEFLEDIEKNGYLQDGEGIIDYKFSMLSDEDTALLNSYIFGKMQFWIGTGDDRIDSMVRYNPYASEVEQARALEKIDRLEKIYRKGDEERKRKRKKIEASVREKKTKQNNRRPPKYRKSNQELEREIAREVNEKSIDRKLIARERKEVMELIEEERADRKEGIQARENILLEEGAKKNPKKIEAYFMQPRNKRIEELKKIDFYNEGTNGGSRLFAEEAADYAYIGNEAIYDEELWKKSIGEIYVSSHFRRPYKVLDKADLYSGVQSVLLKDNKNGNVIMAFQGSNPGIWGRASDPVNWDKDWSNNAENVSWVTNMFSTPLTVIGAGLNAVGKGIKNVGNAISDNSVIKTSEYGGVPSQFEGMTPYMNNVGNYTILSTNEISKKITSIGHSTVFISETASFLSEKEYYKSYEKNTPKQYTDALKLANEWEKKHKVKITDTTGHSLGYGEGMYVASHKNLRAIGVDPAPVRNPGKYINNNKILVIVPDNGKGMLNSIHRITPSDIRSPYRKVYGYTGNASDGGLSYEFQPLGIPLGGMSYRTRDIPAIPVKAKMRNGKKDNHSADIDSVYEEILHINMMLGVE